MADKTLDISTLENWLWQAAYVSLGALSTPADKLAQGLATC